VPIEGTVPRLCEIVSYLDDYSDCAYDAIIALGSIPGTWNHAPVAAKALYNAIGPMRGAPWKDALRVAAITGLGKLQVSEFAPLLLDELTDDNPGIVRAAAQATAQVLGIGPAVIRIVEVAAKTDENGVLSLGRALRWLNREAVAAELEAQMGIGSNAQQNAARLLLGELGGTVAFQKLRARTDVMHQYSDVLERAEEKIRVLFESSVHEAQSGFQIAIYMDLAVFVLGIALIIVSATLAFKHDGNLKDWAGVGVPGVTGVLGVLYSLLVANPRKKVSEAVDHLMRLKLIFLSYLRRLHQIDQAYARRLLDDKPISPDETKHFTETVGRIMEDTLKCISESEKKRSD
jgi:hypothetical protein